MIHLDSSWVVFEEGMVGFFLVKMIVVVFDRQPPGNDHNPPPTSHVEVSENHRLQNAQPGMGYYVNSQARAMVFWQSLYLLLGPYRKPRTVGLGETLLVERLV